MAKRRKNITRKAGLKIESCAKKVHDSIKKNRRPKLRYPVRSLSNVKYNPKSGYL